MAMNVPRVGGDQATCEVNTTPPAIPPQAIHIDIDSDGTIVWNSEPLSDIVALDANFRQESAKDPQAQIRLRPSAHANYDVIANVMASAQRNNMMHMGFANIAEFAD
jgi:biopolymer transport protein ExbD